MPEVRQRQTRCFQLIYMERILADFL